MNSWGMKKAILAAAAAALAVCIWGVSGTTTASAQSQDPEASSGTAPINPTAPTGPVQIDPYDRVAQLWYRQRIAKSGPERGREIAYMSCWMCHNEYTIAADPKNHAPSLIGLFKNPAVTDEVVMAKIRSGGPRMPAYPPTLMTDQDLRDVVSYLRQYCGKFPTERGGGGCFDEQNPPANPLYKAN